MSNITDRLFFAIRPDAAATARIEALRATLCAEQGLIGTLLPADQFQITLYHLGDFARYPQDLVDKAIAAGAKLSVPAFELVLDQAMSLKRREPRKLPCVLTTREPLAPLQALHAQLVAALKAAGLYRYASFTPQLPLLHDNIPVEPQAVEPVGWVVNELLLVRSRLGKGEDEILARWPLV
jgi:2'-5' RNA ligase